MTVRGLLLALVLLASMPVEAASCHRYSRWFYPWPQRCFGQKLVSVRHKVVYPPAGDRPDFDIPLPMLSIDDYGGGEPDEVTAARLTLLGYAYAH